ncbi:MAG: RNA polymerase sigma factor [Candidatus Nealsonbacteria bacterium]|nr:RNA polymerase sigma factor [Candidatus Nealsonbacteria bacterium]
MDHLQKEFGKLYDQHIGKIYRFVFLRVNSTETAQDLTSETFVRAWDRFKAGGSEPGVKNWAAFLYQIARNLVTDFYREKGKIQIVSASYVADPNPALDLENQAFLNSDVERIKAALSKLGEEHQEVIIWRYLDGLSNKEIAEILGKPEGTVRVIVHRALEALRKTLA